MADLSKHDPKWACNFSDHVAYNKARLSLLYAKAQAGVPAAIEALDSFESISADELSALHAAGGCPQENVDMSGKGGFTIVGKATPSGSQPITPSGLPSSPSIETKGEEPQIFTEAGAAVPDIMFFHPEESTNGSGSGIPDVGLRLAEEEKDIVEDIVAGRQDIDDVLVSDDEAANGALVAHEPIPGLVVPLAYPKRPLAWAGALMLATSLVAGGVYLLGKLGKR